MAITVDPDANEGWCKLLEGTDDEDIEYGCRPRVLLIPVRLRGILANLLINVELERESGVEREGENNRKMKRDRVGVR